MTSETTIDRDTLISNIKEDVKGIVDKSLINFSDTTNVTDAVTHKVSENPLSGVFRITIEFEFSDMYVRWDHMKDVQELLNEGGYSKPTMRVRDGRFEVEIWTYGGMNISDEVTVTEEGDE